MPQLRNIFIFLVAIILAACSHTTPCRRMETMLAVADSLMEGSPDSALTMLKDIAPDIAKLPKDIAMRHALLTAKAQNKAYVAFTTDSVMLVVADYYDSHGTANERMLAHYLLGCAYRDMHEAPIALSCYYDALEKADTLSTDCDYTTMMRIWGQIAEVYSDQLMPHSHTQANQQFMWYAKKANRIFEYIRGVELQIRSHVLLEDTSKSLAATKEAHSLYLENGMIEKSNSVYAEEISIHINRNELDKAKELIHKYENESDLFDEEHKIAPDRTFYYVIKGNYYSALNQIDSAKFYYNKAIDTYPFNAYCGLMELSSKQSQIDSALYYFKLYSQAYDKNIYELNTNAVMQVQGLYDYTRQQRIATQKEKEANRLERIIFATFVLAVMLMMLVFMVYSRYKQQKHKEISIISQKLLDTSIAYEKAKSDAEMLNKNFNALQKRKDQEIEELGKELNELKTSLKKLNTSNNDDVMKLEEIVKFWQDALSKPSQLIEPISKKDMCKIETLFKKVYSELYACLASGNKLTPTELQCAIFVRLGFHTNDIALMLDKTAQRVSNIKSSINRKIFGINGSRNFKTNLFKMTEDH